MTRPMAVMLAAATLVGWSEQRTTHGGRALFAALARSIAASEPGSALAAARDWLEGPGLSESLWEKVDRGLVSLEQAISGPIDWNAEAANCFAYDDRHGNFVLSPLLARSVARVLDLPIQGSFACLYSASASIAWALAEERDVTLYADQEVAILTALLARAACRRIDVKCLNPLDGTRMPGSFVHDGPGFNPPFEHFDHIVAAPPFGARLSEGPAKGQTIEACVLDRLSGRATRSFSVIVSDGILFRESGNDVHLRRTLSDRYAVSVISLPGGMYWPASAISTSLLRLEATNSAGVRLIDARTMEKSSSGRVQEGLIVQQLEGFRGFRSSDPEREVRVPPDELVDNGFSFMPDRYIRSGRLALMDQAMEHRATVALADVATIERGKAPIPMREIDGDPPLTAMEIAPSDIVDGIVNAPRKQQAFDMREEARVRGVTVTGDDILVSIKGNVGNVGLVPVDAQLASDMGDPWIVSQSLAILRLKPDNPYIRSTRVLHALLTAPWVREKLESMSGATTVRTLPMNALRGLQLPVPTAEECAEAELALVDVDAIREKIEALTSILSDRQRQIWAQLWQLPGGVDDA